MKHSNVCISKGTAAVSCSPDGPVLGGGRNGDLVTSKPCCAWVGARVMHGWRMGGVSIYDKISEVGPEHWGLVLDEVC